MVTAAANPVQYFEQVWQHCHSYKMILWYPLVWYQLGHWIPSATARWGIRGRADALHPSQLASLQWMQYQQWVQCFRASFGVWFLNTYGTWVSPGIQYPWKPNYSPLYIMNIISPGPTVGHGKLGRAAILCGAVIQGSCALSSQYVELGVGANWEQRLWLHWSQGGDGTRAVLLFQHENKHHSLVIFREREISRGGAEWGKVSSVPQLTPLCAWPWKPPRQCSNSHVCHPLVNIYPSCCCQGWDAGAVAGVALLLLSPYLTSLWFKSTHTASSESCSLKSGQAIYFFIF